MLNYRNTSIVFILIIIGMVYQNTLTHFTLWYFLIPIIIFSLVLFYGSYFINSNFFIKAHCKSYLNKNEVALTFDDGPNPNTNKVLSILKSNNVTSAFFCIGNRINENPNIIKRIHEEGHIIGNHSFTHHALFDLMSKNQMKNEIRETNIEAKKILGLDLLMFRPPYGVTTPVLAKAIKEEGLTTIGWSLRSYDTMINDEQKLIQKIKMNIKPGDIILLHDSQNVTVSALEEIIKVIREKGYKIIRLDQLLKLEAYA